MNPRAENTTTQTALTIAVLNAYCLWAFTHLQFLIIFGGYGLPPFGEISTSSRGLQYYIPPEGMWLPTPVLFFCLSIALAVFALGGIVTVSKGAHGRIRIGMLVLIFAVIELGFSWYVLQSRHWHEQHLEFYLEDLKQNPKYRSWVWGPEWVDREIEQSSETLRRYRDYWE